MLKGAELLAKVAALAGQSKSDIARACGYVATKKDGSERILFSAYYEAIIEAKGVDLGTPAKAAPKRDKAPSYKATVSKAGTCPVGAAYISEAGFGPGDTLGLVVSPGSITIERVAVAPAASPEAQAPAATSPEAAPVVVTYDSAPAPAAERELAPF